MSELKDLKIAGSRTMPGGHYDKIKIAGAGKIDGDCIANEIKISGAGKMLGKCKTGTLVVSGAGTFEGSIDADKISVSGNTSAKLHVNVEKISVSGSFNCKGGLTGGEITSSGIVKCKGDIKCKSMKSSGALLAKSVECDDFVSHGLIKIPEMLNSENIDITLSERSSIGQIGGRTIKIVGKSGLKPFAFGSASSVELNSDFIEGDDIELENVKAKEVSAQNVTIGKNCTIDKVVYSLTLNVDKNSTVKEKIKV